jgi:DNA repair photolyase
MNEQLITDSAQKLIDETTVQKGPKKNVSGRVTFVGNPLKVFGVLFNHAYPLDLSITKYCFQGCPFCFATANKRATGDVIGKNEDPTSLFIRRLQKANGQGYNPESLIEYCLRNKYPIVFSNNVDPFMPASEHQFKLGERVLEACLEFRQPLWVQTKEVYYGERVKELLIQGKDIFHLYVSISTLDYEKAKRYETVAVTPQQRLERIREMTDAGMTATVALNPYCPEWQPDLAAYFDAVKACGAKGVYTDLLHFTPNQKKVMPKRFAEFTEKSNRYMDFDADVKIMEKLCAERGLKLHYTRRLPDDFYNGNALYKDEQLWPIDARKVMERVHQVWDQEKSPVLITWKDVNDYFEKFHKETWNHIFNMNEFAGVLWTDNEKFFQVKNALGPRNKMKNICRFIWNNPELQDHLFSFYTDVYQLVDSEGEEDGTPEIVTDDSDDLICVYAPGYTKDAYSFDQNDPEFANGLISLD